jgi:hypothetical protein
MFSDFGILGGSHACRSKSGREKNSEEGSTMPSSSTAFAIVDHAARLAGTLLPGRMPTQSTTFLFWTASFTRSAEISSIHSSAIGIPSFWVGVVEVADAERQAVLKAIHSWEEIKSVIHDEVQRLPSTAHSAFEGEANDLTIGIDGNRTGAQAPENPEDRFD